MFNILLDYIFGFSKFSFDITHVAKDCNGVITDVKTSDGSSFPVADVINKIKTGTNFYVRSNGLLARSIVKIVHRKDGTEYIRSDSDLFGEDNLDNLPTYTPPNYRPLSKLGQIK